MEEWHFVQACPNWPEGEYTEQLDTPPVAELCERCVEFSAFELEELPHRRKLNLVRAARR
jgi:hypothetical protein